jgi:hypothetical protein
MKHLDYVTGSIHYFDVLYIGRNRGSISNVSSDMSVTFIFAHWILLMVLVTVLV